MSVLASFNSAKSHLPSVRECLSFSHLKRSGKLHLSRLKCILLWMDLASGKSSNDYTHFAVSSLAYAYRIGQCVLVQGL